MKTSIDVQAHNKKVHTTALSATKFGDGLVDPKLVLSWLLNSLGASVFWIGLLVPVREAGALLPQLITANMLRRVQVRKWWWVFGSLVQGLMVLAIAAIALLFTGDTAGLLILLSLGVFAVARSICSVSYKDVLGKTVEKQRRGLVTGTASSVAGFGVLVFGLLLLFGVFEQRSIVFGALFLASVLWIIAAVRFSALIEVASVIDATDTESVAKKYLRYLTQDAELQKFLIVRGLLTATAVAPPFILIMAESENLSLLSQLGGLVVASSLATFVSGRVWGALSDKSSSLVLAYAGLSSVVFLLLSLWGMHVGWNSSLFFLPVIVFGIMVSYQGVRIARSIHLVNLAREDTRAAYTAISNTIIGVVLLATGFLGVLAEVAGVEVVVWTLTVMSLLGGLIAFRLENP
jgi:MFS family permease